MKQILFFRCGRHVGCRTHGTHMTWQVCSHRSRRLVWLKGCGVVEEAVYGEGVVMVRKRREVMVVVIVVVVVMVVVVVVDQVIDCM
jgi:hypothetical protein